MAVTPDAWFQQLPEDQQPLLKELRQLILSTNSNFEEAIKWGQPCYSRTSLVCYLNGFKSYVVLGFQKGAHLEDADGLLEGNGKDLRHIKVRAAGDIKKTAFRKLIRSALRFDAEGGR